MSDVIADSDKSGTSATDVLIGNVQEAKSDVVVTDQPFYATFENAELKEFAEKRGWKNNEAVVKSYQELEKFQGVPKDQIIKVPKDAGDKEGWDQVYAKLGRPETADKYELPIPEGQDPAFAGEASKWMHDAGISKQAAQILATKWNEYIGNMQKTSIAKFQEQGQKELAELKAELGNGFDSTIESGRRLFQQVGIDTDTSNVLEGALGTGRYLKLMGKLGTLISESQFIDGVSGGSFNKMTPAIARETMAVKIRDKEFQRRIASKDSAALKEWDDLNRAIAAGGSY
jgi:hypothetical protein